MNNSPQDISIQTLRSECIEKQEVQDGYVYTFHGTNETLNQLFAFILFHREHLPLFKFELTVQDVKRNIRLKVTGPEGAKDTLLLEIKLQKPDD